MTFLKSQIIQLVAPLTSAFVLFSKAIFMFSSIKTLENIKGFNHKATLTLLTYLDLCEFLCLHSSSDKRNMAQHDTQGRG